MKPNWIDVTMAITPDMMVYKNKEEKKPQVITMANHEVNGYHESRLCMDLHTGTHLDMPLHMVANGADSSTFNLDKVNGKAFVIDFSRLEETAITEEHLKPYEMSIKAAEIIILKTKNSLSETFVFEFDYLAASGASYLATHAIKAVGIDALGIERGSSEHETHTILMHSDTIIIEGLALKDITEGFYNFYCFPLKIMGVEGLPARAFLEEHV